MKFIIRIDHSTIDNFPKNTRSEGIALSNNQLNSQKEEDKNDSLQAPYLSKGYYRGKWNTRTRNHISKWLA